MPSATRSMVSAVVLLLAASAAAQTTAPPSTASATKPTITAVSECHGHGTVEWCMVGTEEYQVVGPTATEQFQAEYTDCHTHGADTYCVDDAGEDVQILVDAAEEGETTEPAAGEEPAGSEEHCHFHAGVEHCVGAGESESESAPKTCDVKARDYNVPLRVGLLFVILVTSAIGVFIPIVSTRFNLVSHTNILFVILKQFGTGVIISTAFVHLFTHADLMFGNECLGELQFEGTTAAIFMAGLFLSFLADYIGARFVQWRQSKRSATTSGPPASAHDDESADKSVTTGPDQEFQGGMAHAHGLTRAATPMEMKVNVYNLEAGIIFHSILIGITLVVAGDTFFITLFIVIIFHQMFEGMALGTCIAELPKSAASTLHKCIMAIVFSLITPIGMAIGIGVLNEFNGNDPSTIVALGTLDALSAGILAWVGIVEMLAKDWLQGRLMNASFGRTMCALISLIAGMILMSFLGKWA